MGVYSGATYRPISWAQRTRSGTKPTAVVLHVTASNASSQYDYFKNSGAACSHFHVAKNGHVEQYIDTVYRSAADLDGNYRTISIETQGLDDGTGWTPEQVTAIAGIVAWANVEHGIPLRLMESSFTSEHGLGWHRLGIDGNWPALPNVLAGRKQRGGGEYWSHATGKTCPCDPRIHQVDDVLAQAQSGSSGFAPSPTPDPGDDDMPTWKKTSYPTDWSFDADGEFRTLKMSVSDDGKETYYSVLNAPAYATGTLSVTLTGLAKGHEANLRFIQVDTQSGKDTVVSSVGNVDEHFAGSGTTSLVLPFTCSLNRPDDKAKTRKLRFQLRAFGGEKVTVTETVLRMLAWDRS